MNLGEDTFPKDVMLIALIKSRDRVKESMQIPGNQDQYFEIESIKSQDSHDNWAPNVNYLRGINEEIAERNVELLSKKIVKLEDTLSYNKRITQKLLVSMRNKKADMVQLSNEVNLMYVKVDKISKELEEKVMENESLKEGALNKEKNLGELRDMLTESYRETADLKRELINKDEMLKELRDKLEESQEKNREMMEKVEEGKEENRRLLEYLQAQDAKSKMDREDLVIELKRQERSKEKIKREKTDVAWNKEALRIMLYQGKEELERIKGKYDVKSVEVEKLKKDLMRIRKERDEAKSLCQDIGDNLGMNKSQCTIF